MKFTSEDVREVFRLLAGILHLGNIDFMTAGGAQVSTKTGKDHICAIHGNTDVLIVMWAMIVSTFELFIIDLCIVNLMVS